MALLLLVQAVTAAAPTKQLEVVDTVDTEVATKNNFGCLEARATLSISVKLRLNSQLRLTSLSLLF